MTVVIIIIIVVVAVAAAVAAITILITTTKTTTARRLPSNLMLTVRECMHLVTHGHFQSCDKDGGHTIRYRIVKNLMLHANFMAVCFVEPELLPIKVLHLGYRDFDLFGSCDLDLDPMTFIYELDPKTMEIHHMCRYELPMSRLSKVIVRHTYIHT